MGGFSGGFNKPPHGLRAIMGPGSEDGPMPGAVESDLFECTRRGPGGVATAWGVSQFFSGLFFWVAHLKLAQAPKRVPILFVCRVTPCKDVLDGYLSCCH